MAITFSRKSITLAAAMAVVLMVSTVEVANADFCPSTALVYPYWSTCVLPAKYESETYTLVGTGVLSTGNGLAPEWDETNSTYYVRLSEEPATYKLTYSSSSETRSAVAQGEDVIFVNTATNMMLAWRQEGDEYFLVEAESDTASLQFVQDEDVSLPCPLIFVARCQAYNIISYGSSSGEGLSPYEEDGVVYFKQSSDDVLPFLLLRSSNVLTTVV